MLREVRVEVTVIRRVLDQFKEIFRRQFWRIMIDVRVRTFVFNAFLAALNGLLPLPGSTVKVSASPFAFASETCVGTATSIKEVLAEGGGAELSHPAIPNSIASNNQECSGHLVTNIVSETFAIT